MCVCVYTYTYTCVYTSKDATSQKAQRHVHKRVTPLFFHTHIYRETSHPDMVAMRDFFVYEYVSIHTYIHVDMCLHVGLERCTIKMW